MKFSAVFDEKTGRRNACLFRRFITEVRLLDIEAVKHLEKNSLSLRAFWEEMSEDKAGIYRFQGVPEDFTLCGNRWTAPCGGDLKCSGRYNRIL